MMKFIRIVSNILILAGAVSFILSLIAKVIINDYMFSLLPHVYLAFANACFIFAIALYVFEMAQAKRPKAVAKKKPAKKKTARKR